MFDFILECVISFGAILIAYSGLLYVKQNHKILGIMFLGLGLAVFLFMTAFNWIPSLFTSVSALMIFHFQEVERKADKSVPVLSSKKSSVIQKNRQKSVIKQHNSSIKTNDRILPIVKEHREIPKVKSEAYPLYDLKIHKKRKWLNNYVVVDIETTGLNAATDKVIQLSALKINNGKIVDTFNSYINPGQFNLPLSPFIENLTGIKTESLQNAPSFNKVKKSFLSFVNEYPWIGHNIIRFDIPFLYQSGIGIKEFWAEDTYLLAKKYLNKYILGNLKLETLKKYYHVSVPSHNSLDDCKTTMEVYEHFKNDQLRNFLEDTNDTKAPHSNSLKGLNFVVLGQFPEIYKPYLINQIVLRNGKINKAISKKVDFVLKGISDHQYKLLKKSEDWGFKILTYSDFVKLVNEKDMNQ